MILETLPKESLKKLLNHLLYEIEVINIRIANYEEEDLYDIDMGMKDVAKRKFLYDYQREVKGLIK